MLPHTLLTLLQTQDPLPHSLTWRREGTPLQVVQRTVEDGQGTVEEGTTEEEMEEEEMVEEGTVQEGTVTEGINNILSMHDDIVWCDVASEL